MKLLHTSIKLVILKQHLLQIGRIDGQIIDTRRDQVLLPGVHGAQGGAHLEAEEDCQRRSNRWTRNHKLVAYMDA